MFSHHCNALYNGQTVVCPKKVGNRCTVEIPKDIFVKDGIRQGFLLINDKKVHPSNVDDSKTTTWRDQELKITYIVIEVAL